MADEYSDEEFAADDGDGAAYEAEFDAEEEEEQEEEEHAQPQHQRVATTEDAVDGVVVQADEAVNASEDGAGGEYAEEEEEEAYQESFDADGDGNSEREQGGHGAVAEEAEQEEEEEEQYEEAESYAQDATGWRDDDAVVSVEPLVAEEAPELKAQKDPVQTPAAEDNVAPEPPPLAVLNVVISPVATISESPSAGRQRSASLPQMAELPHVELCADPDLQAKLTRRSSSPRMRPAPMRRLASLGEAGVATIEALLVPTNEVTEEAAAVVSAAAAAAAMDTSSTLVKRPSATFVPRLPSLMELSAPLTADGDQIRDGARSRGSRAATPESAEDDEERDDDENDEGDKQDDDKPRGVEEREDGGDDEEGTEAAGKVMEGEEEHAEGQGHNEHLGRELSDESIVGGGVTSEDCEMENVPGEPVDVDSTGAAALEAVSLQRPKTPSSSEEGHDAEPVPKVLLTVHGVGEGGIMDDALRNDVIDLEEEDGGEDESASLRQAASESEKPVDEDLMERLMADVEYKDDANAVEDEDGEEDAAYAGDDTEFVVDAEDGDRRETRQLLQEAQMIITKQKEAERAVSPGYEDDDPFSDDDGEYADEEEHAEDTRPSLVQYDSDYEELGIDEDDADEPRDFKPVSTQQPESTNATQSKTTSVEDEKRAVKPTEENDLVRENATPTIADETVAAAPKVEVVAEETKPTPTEKKAMPTPSSSRTTPLVAAHRSFRPVSVTSKAPNQEAKPSRSMSQGSPRKPAKPPVDPSPVSAPRKAEVPKFTPRAPAPRQPPATPTPVISPTVALREQPDDQKVTVVQATQPKEAPRPASPTKSSEGGVRASSPVRGALQAAPKSPAAPLPRKAPVFKQKKVPKAASPDSKSKRLKPVKCPPNLRIDIASHMDREKREWLLLNMFRHGDDVTKYEAFIPTSAAHQHISEAIAGVDMAMGEVKRPLSARQIYGEPLAQHASRGAYSRHGGRKLVNRPVDPRLEERESSWVSIKSSESSIPAYDSILDKYCKTVTSPVVQRRIYETREYDLSPQLALVLEKRAFKEWKHGETDSGFGSVSKSYKTAVVPPSASTKSLYPTRPPSSSSSVSAHTNPSAGGSTMVFDPEEST